MADEPIRQDGESLIQFARRRAEFFGFTTSTPSTPAPAPVSVDLGDDLVPEISSDRTPEQYEMDAVLGRLDVVEAYNRWVGKGRCEPGDKTSNIMISCPVPGHEDRNPSADINLTKGDGGVWNCHRCGVGGDKYTLAAIAFGIDDYQSKANFPELRRIMAEDLGYVVVVAGKDEWLVKAEPTPTPATPTPEAAPTGLTDDRAPELAALPEIPTIDWRDIPSITEGTFLHAWMTLTSQSFEPEEFYLWEGLMALAAAVGNNVIYADSIPVRPNMMVCLVGGTGAGKSISMSLFEKLLHEAMPFRRDTGGGVRPIGSAGSGEALVDQFAHTITDTSTGTKIEMPVNGVVKEGELAGLMKRITRNGNTTREVLMDLYDRPLPVSITSRGHGEVTVRDHFMQMVTSTQPGSIRQLLTLNDGTAGFLNRWVFAFGNPKMRPPRSMFRADVAPAVEPLRHVRAWGSGGVVVDWADDAAGPMWDDFFERRIRSYTLDDEAWITSRLPLLAKKLVLLFAINDRVDRIKVDHVRSVECMWDYILQSYGIVETKVGMDDLNTCMEAVVQYIAQRGEPVTIRQLSKQSGARRFGQDLVNKSIDILAKGGIIEELPRVKSDRTPRYQLPDDEYVTPALSLLPGGRS